MRRTRSGGIGTGHGDVAQSELLKMYVIGFQEAVALQLKTRLIDERLTIVVGECVIWTVQVHRRHLK